MKLLHIQKRDNVEFYLCCKFQLLPFSVLCKTDVKDGKIAPQVLMPRGIHAATCSFLLANCIGIINTAMSLQLISCCLQSMQCANHIIGSAMKKSLVTDSAEWCFSVYSASTRIQNAQTERRKLLRICN